MKTEKTTILIDREKTDKLIELGFNISSVCRAAIDQALDVSSEDLIFDMRLRRVEEELVLQIGKEQDLTVTLDYCRSRVKYLKEEIQRLKADSINAIAVSKYSATVTKVNRIILAAHYDRNAIDEALKTEAGKVILEEMLGINPTFDLTKQISNLRDVMES